MATLLGLATTKNARHGHPYLSGGANIEKVGSARYLETLARQQAGLMPRHENP